MFSVLRAIISNLTETSAQSSASLQTHAAPLANSDVVLADVLSALVSAYGVHKPDITSLDSTNLGSAMLGKVPWKCFWCIVALCYLLPVVSNLAAQELGTAYCSLRHLKPEECVELRYAIIAIMVLVTPLEVFPIVKACHVEENCHSEDDTE